MGAARGAGGTGGALCRAVSLTLYVCASYATFKASARGERPEPRREAAALWAHLGLLRCVAGLTRSRGLEALGAVLLVGGYLGGHPSPALADVVFARAEVWLAAAHARCAAHLRQWLLSALGAQTRHMDLELLAELRAVLAAAKADVERAQEERRALSLPPCDADAEAKQQQSSSPQLLPPQSLPPQLLPPQSLPPQSLPPKSLPQQSLRQDLARESPRHGAAATTARVAQPKRAAKSVVFADNVRYVEPARATGEEEEEEEQQQPGVRVEAATLPSEDAPESDSEHKEHTKAIRWVSARPNKGRRDTKRFDDLHMVVDPDDPEMLSSLLEPDEPQEEHQVRAAGGSGSGSKELIDEYVFEALEEQHEQASLRVPLAAPAQVALPIPPGHGWRAKVAPRRHSLPAYMNEPGPGL